MLTVASVIVVGWLLAATIGTWAYFAGDGITGRSDAGNATNVPQF